MLLLAIIFRCTHHAFSFEFIFYSFLIKGLLTKKRICYPSPQMYSNNQLEHYLDMHFSISISMTATDQVLITSSAYLYFWSWSTFIAILFKRIQHIGYESVIWEEHKSLFAFSPNTFDLFQLMCTIQQTNRQTDRSSWVKIIIYYNNLKLAVDIIFYVLLLITLVFFM